MIWKLGIEVELLAPEGSSRKDLAERVAAQCGGAVTPLFHHQAEPSAAPGVPVFETLMQGFEVRDEGGVPIARFIDDLTLQGGLDRAAPARPGWYRIASDDVRLLRILKHHADPAARLETVLDAPALAMGGTVSLKPGGIRRLADGEGASLALAAPLPGQRERACEIVTAPMTGDHHARLDALLAPARDMGFLLPLEGAAHLHFDAAPLCNARALQALVLRLEAERDALRRACVTNPNCRRLGAHPAKVLEAIGDPGFAGLDWPEAMARLSAAGPTKYCDFNILNMLGRDEDKHTIEIRILGPSLDTDWIIDRAVLFETMLWEALAEAG